jgi:hypothetical protein
MLGAGYAGWLVMLRDTVNVLDISSRSPYAGPGQAPAAHTPGQVRYRPLAFEIRGR